MLQSIIACFAQQDEANKATNDRLATLAAAHETLDIEGNEIDTERRRVFATTNPNPGVGQPTDGANPANADTAHTTSGADTLTSQRDPFDNKMRSHSHICAIDRQMTNVSQLRLSHPELKGILLDILTNQQSLNIDDRKEEHEIIE